jgi:hypothetical protein
MIKQAPFQKDIVSISNTVFIDRTWIVDRVDEPKSKRHQLISSEIAPSMYSFYHADDNHRPTIVKDVVQVRFHLLNTLNLSGNDIHSIEELPNIYMPHI